MALIDKASLLMVPSTYEAGTLYNVLPSGNRAPDSTDQNSGYDQTRADFTFDRGSNAAATRIGSDGIIEKYRENVLTYSKNLSSSGWTGSGCTSASAEDFEGGNDANQLTSSSSNGFWYHPFSSTGVQTLSIYAKAGTGDVLRLRLDSSTSPQAYFDLSSGTITNQTNNIDATITAVSGADGWYKCTLTGNVSSPNNVRIYPTQNTNVVVYKVQLETGLVATDYLDSGATTAKAGVLIDLPRINYDANGENGALLLEPQRVNKIQYANYFNSWAKTSASVTTNAVTSPDGLKNASKLVEASGSSFHFILTTPTIASGAATFSFYAKSAERTSVSAFLTQSGNNGANFDLSAETATAQGTGNTATIESVGDGWYRCVVTNSGSAQIASQVRIGVQNGALDSYVGDGTSGVYLYGAQLEAGSYATSYIPNHGTSGGVTRAADSLFVESLADELTTGYTEATLYLEFKYKQESVGDAFVFGQDNNTYPAGRGYLYNKQVGFADTFGGGGFSNITEDTTLKLIYRLNSLSNADVFLNATKGTNVSGTAWSAINQIRFRGAYYTFEISQIAMFNEALTDAECITLTTL